MNITYGRLAPSSNRSLPTPAVLRSRMGGQILKDNLAGKTPIAQALIKSVEPKNIATKLADALMAKKEYTRTGAPAPQMQFQNYMQQTSPAPQMMSQMQMPMTRGLPPRVQSGMQYGSTPNPPQMIPQQILRQPQIMPQQPQMMQNRAPSISNTQDQMGYYRQPNRAF